MKTTCGHSEPASVSHPSPARPSLLHLVSEEEIEVMRTAVASGLLPMDFVAKLDRLSSRGLLHQFIAESCHDFIRLLAAEEFGAIGRVDAAARERLFRVLAYVRKDNDAIPDFKPNGFEDDLREVRAATSEMRPLLQQFKEWHLRHDVPRMWAS